MCGIVGVVRFDPEARIERALVDEMTDALRHRGPDDRGVWVDGAVALGHRRLAVIDLSVRGRQPMENEDGTVRIVFNGEIYGFATLRAELQAKGHHFRSETDTEVVLHLWEEHGPALLPRLRGMFAFAIWDARTQELFVARDRLGKKPVHWRSDARGFSFASEVAALLCDPEVERRLDPLALSDYLTFGYVPSPRTGLAGVQKLPPAHYLIVRDGRVKMRRWWSLVYEPKHARSEEDLLEELGARLEDAVRDRLVADVPLGALLSGGLDSTLVVAMMRKAGVARLRTFSIGFPEERWNELPHARTVARLFETEHEDLVVEPEATVILPRIVRHYGEPFADSSALPSFWLCEMARRSVTVALGGDGGDESFGGYDRYAAARVAGWFDVIPAHLRAGSAAFALRLVPPGGPKTCAHRARRFLQELALPPRRRYAGWLVTFPDELKRRLCTGDLRAAVEACDSLAVLDAAYDQSDARAFVEATMHVDLQTYLPDDLLVKMDVASMAHALEVRSPLLDHRVVEFAARLPLRMKLRGLTRKWALKRLLRGRVPDALIERPKSGFGVPIDRWFRGELLPMTRDLLLDARAVSRGWFEREEVSRLIDEHAAGRALHHPRLWALLVLEIWARQTIEEARPSGL